MYIVVRGVTGAKSRAGTVSFSVSLHSFLGICLLSSLGVGCLNH